jgi:hypothetical protein
MASYTELNLQKYNNGDSVMNDLDMNDWGWFVDIDDSYILYIKQHTNASFKNSMHNNSNNYNRQILQTIYEEKIMQYSDIYNKHLCTFVETDDIAKHIMTFKQLYYNKLYVAYNIVCNVIDNVCLFKYSRV